MFIMTVTLVRYSKIQKERYILIPSIAREKKDYFVLERLEIRF